MWSRLQWQMLRAVIHINYIVQADRRQNVKLYLSVIKHHGMKMYGGDEVQHKAV